MNEIISSLKINIPYISNEDYKKYQNDIYKIEYLDFIDEKLNTLDENN